MPRPRTPGAHSSSCLADLTEHNHNVLFELAMRIAEDRPVLLVRAKGTGRIFDRRSPAPHGGVQPERLAATVAEDLPALVAHIKASWDNRESAETYRGILIRRGE